MNDPSTIQKNALSMAIMKILWKFILVVLGV